MFTYLGFALCIVAIGVFLGSLRGGEVVKTVGSGIVPKGLLTVELVIIILLSATLTLFCSNLLGIPLSTSEVTIGSVVGVGVAYKALFVNNIMVIVAFWILIPLIAFMIAWIAGRFITKLEKRDRRWRGEQGWWKHGLMLLVIMAGFIEAFSAGMNNVANAVGPLVGANLIATDKGILWGGIFVALGAILLGGRVLELRICHCCRAL
jgi:sulfate permease